jgi:DNA invertase Pin-like site-specific DNA recombinase
MSKMLLGIMGSVAQFERSMILERQREGIAKAKEAGAYKGRKSAFDATTSKVIRERVATGEAIAVIAREFAVTRPTIYRVLGRHQLTALPKRQSGSSLTIQERNN